MISAPAHPNERRRLRALDDLVLLDTPADPYLDAIVRLASRIFSVETALISLVAEDRQWFKARVGLDAIETPREISFCAHAILGDQQLVVENAAKDVRFSDNPLVSGAPSIQFYAGQPLTVAGEAIGTLCLIDRNSKQLNDVELKNLKDLALLAEGYISMRGQTAHIAQLRKVLDGEQRRAMLDPLTQTWNRLGLRKLLDSWQVEADGRFQLGIAYCDLDHFKSINDQYGHAVGDRVLQGAARALSEVLREGDLIGRLGGEEFVVLVKLETVSEMPGIAERLREAVEQAADMHSPLTVSIGTAILEKGETFDQALHRADQAMYQAKKNGRNNVIAAVSFP
ncbi:sensor domain-containing diguanylate cyclase [Pseudomonas sp.]|uniref:GGDEF domain-containing protein n=1 Tax=Pseudomonas sp. TaxID=306 RepID=UPI00289CDDD1|nr:sensor domain-containing diguanylate cyclase [Pseudomonas sp.]